MEANNDNEYLQLKLEILLQFSQTHPKEKMLAVKSDILICII